MISYNDLLYFTELTATLNFSRAAERIGISQPSLTAAIKRLERFLGTDLFIRDKHKVLLTQAGKNLLLHAGEFFKLWEKTKASCLYSKTTVEGCITLGCHHSIALNLLPKFMAKVVKNYPNLEIKLKHDLSRKITEEIINYTIDIGIVVNPVKHPDLVIKKLVDDYFGCWKVKSSKSSKEKINIICDPELHQTQWILKKLKSAGFHYHKMITTNSLEVIAHLTAAGVGIGILPCSVINTLHSTFIKLPQTPTFHDEICIAYRPENCNIYAVKMIAKELREII